MKQIRIGIGGRLGVAFGAVAALAVAANLIAQRGITVIHTTTTRIERAPANTAPAAPKPLPVPEVAEPPAAPVYETLSGDRVGIASDHFARAVQSRAEQSSESWTSVVTESAKELDRAVADYGRHATGLISASSIRRVQERAKSYQTDGSTLIAQADSRRRILQSYWARFEQLDGRMQTALDHTMKIFGRVLARQSLIDLKTNLDDLRQRFAGYATAGARSVDVASVAQSESRLIDSLHKNSRSLASGQSQQWVDQTSEDLRTLTQIRESLTQLEEDRKQTGAALARDAAALAKLVETRSVQRKDAETQAGDILKPASGTSAHAQPSARSATDAASGGSGAQTATVYEGMPSSMVAANAGDAAAPTLAGTTTTPLKRQAVPQSHALLWLSGTVLLLLLLICVATVSSIVMPVKRIVAATARLAKGEASVRVPRGGIRELDGLAVAFNEMSAQLAAAQAVARDYQSSLEYRVDERTRQLQHLAEHDPLTQLPNRRQLFSHLAASLERARRDQLFVGVFFLDLDNFKNINDSMGHAYGDRVLLGIAERLREACGPGGFAARLGGDEFTVVHADAHAVDEVYEAGWEIVRAFQKPVCIDDREIIVSVSVGASVYPEHDQNAESLLRAADAALFRAKALGRSQLTIFSPELLEAAASKFSTEQGLRRAIDRGEFELVFQPEVNVETLEVGLVEALLRWRTPDGRLATPSEFLAIAEESGLIMQISDWVLRSAIEVAARWHHGAWPDARIAINVSSRQLLDSRFVDRVQDLLKIHRLPPRCIEIELTENVLQTGSATIEALRRLRSHGISIALDDFGTGYSSLASLEQLPLSRVKLDRSLIASIDTSARSIAIARAIIGLCHSLGLEITAEGIERPEQLALLLNNRSTYLQGYLISRPVSQEELLPVRAMLQNQMESAILSLPAQSTRPQELAYVGGVKGRVTPIASGTKATG